MKSKFNVRVRDIVFTRKSAEVGSKVMKCNARSTPWKLIDKDLNESRGGNIKRLSRVQATLRRTDRFTGEREERHFARYVFYTDWELAVYKSHSSSRMRINNFAELVVPCEFVQRALLHMYQHRTFTAIAKLKNDTRWFHYRWFSSHCYLRIYYVSIRASLASYLR